MLAAWLSPCTHPGPFSFPRAPQGHDLAPCVAHATQAWGPPGDKDTPRGGCQGHRWARGGGIPKNTPLPNPSQTHSGSLREGGPGPAPCPRCPGGVGTPRKTATPPGWGTGTAGPGHGNPPGPGEGSEFRLPQPEGGSPPAALPSPNPPRFGGAGAALRGAASPCSSPVPGAPLRLRDFIFLSPSRRSFASKTPQRGLPERCASLRGFPKKTHPGLLRDREPISSLVRHRESRGGGAPP